MWKSLLAPLSRAEVMGFSARRAVKGNEQGIRACGSFAVAWMPLPFSRRRSAAAVAPILYDRVSPALFPDDRGLS